MTPPVQKEIPKPRASNRVAGKDPMTASEIDAEYNIPKTKPTTGIMEQQELRPGASSVARLSETAEERKERVAQSLQKQTNNTNQPPLVQSEKDISTMVDKEMIQEVSTEKCGLSTHTDDPEPLDSSATAAEKAAHKKVVLQYSQDLYDAYSEMSSRGETLWLDFTTAFRPQTIKLWPRAMASKWADLLLQRGIMVKLGKRMPLASAIIDLLYREDHIACTEVDQIAREINKKTPEMKQKMNMEIHKQQGKSRAFTESVPSIYTRPSGDPDDDDDDSSDDEDDDEDKEWNPWSSGRKDDANEENEEPHEEIKNKKEGKKYSSSNSEDKKESEAYSLGVNGLMKAYARQKLFTGAWDEDLDTSLGIYDTMSTMCQVQPTEKLQAMPVMLSGNALNYFSTKAKDCKTYEEAAHLLKMWYNSKEKKSRILHAWQTMTLSNAMSQEPDSSQVDVFRSFVAKLLSLQKQLDNSYHDDRFLRDRLLSAVDIPSIQESLRDRVPRNSTAVINRVANRLSEKPRTAGSSSVMWTEGETDDLEAHYSLGRTYGGNARGNIKAPWKNKNYRRTRQGTGPTQRNSGRNDRRRLNSQWLRGVKGCFVCGRDHFARERHSREEITSAIRKLKEKQPSALLTVGDLDYIQNMGIDDQQEEEEQQSSDNDIQWAEQDDGDLSEGTDAYVLEVDMNSIEKGLANNALSHALFSNSEYNTYPKQLNCNVRERMGIIPQAEFKGVRLDTCANRASIMSIWQYNAYCYEFDLPSKLMKDTDRTIKGIGGRLKAIGEARIQIPFTRLSLVIDVNFLIVKEKVPSLLSMKDMIDNGLDLSIQKRQLQFRSRVEPLLFNNYFLIYVWSKESIPFALYTHSELKTIHRTFGHPSVKATSSLLRRAKGEDIDRKTREAITQISRDCKICAKEAAAPRRFKLSVGTEELRFNYCVQVDVMFIQNRPVLHMVDEATHLCAATFLRKQTTSEIWKSIQQMWSNVYMGPPDFLSVDQGSAFISREMKQTAETYGVQLREAPIENPGTIGIVERYHAPLRRGYLCLRSDLDATVSDADCLSMAVFAMNSTTGPEGLCPILLVFGAMPRPARISPSSSQVARAEAIERARKEVDKEQGKRRIAFGLKHKHGPKAREASQRLMDLPHGAYVWVYRKTSGKWEGPHKFVTVNGETAVIQLPRGRKIFRSTCVRPYVRRRAPESVNQKNETAWIADMPGRAKKAEGSKKDLAKEFAGARRTELQGLVNNGTFMPVEKSKIPNNARVFGSRFVDELKKANTGIRKKSRLVAQNYCDEDATTIATKAPTIQRYSSRLLLSLAVSDPSMKVFTRDITQAYVQSKSELERDIYIRAPQELNLPDDMVLKVVKPLYGIPESGLHWYLTYLEYHLGDLRMERTTCDPCLLFKRNGTKMQAMVALQVDDSLTCGDEDFVREEQKASTKFKSKDRDFLEKRKRLTFNGLDITTPRNGIFVTSQQSKIRNLKLVSDDKMFRSQRAAGQYIGTSVRPDICAALQLLAPGKDETTKAEYKALNDAIIFLQQTEEKGLSFVAIDMKTARLVLITDASFGNARGDKSQLGYMILLADENNKANIIQYASSRCKRVTRSVLAAEVHALVAGFDAAYVLQHMIQEVTGMNLQLEAYVDSRTLFQVVTKDGATSEKRLQIDLSALKQSYNTGELWQLGWIPGHANPSDALTKSSYSLKTPMWILMSENKLDIEPLGWSISRKETKDDEEQVLWGAEMKDNKDTVPQPTPFAALALGNNNCNEMKMSNASEHGNLICNKTEVMMALALGKEDCNKMNVINASGHDNLDCTETGAMTALALGGNNCSETKMNTALAIGADVCNENENDHIGS